MPDKPEIELVVDGRGELGEGPVWDMASQQLVWVDILQRRVHRYRPADARQSALPVPLPVGSVAVRVGGGLVLALEDGFHLLGPDGATLRRLAPVEEDLLGNRMNDGRCDRQGRFWAGSMAYDLRAGAGSLYRLDPDGRVTRIMGAVTISNGIAWSPDDGTVYYIDSPTQRIQAFDFQASDGTIANGRTIVEVPPELGMPDGMTVDADGHLWVALWGGWAVHRYTPDGVLERVVRLPVSHVTSCAFGGPDLDDLYITSARVGLNEDDLKGQPHAGGLFRYRPGVKGLPPATFGG